MDYSVFFPDDKYHESLPAFLEFSVMGIETNGEFFSPKKIQVLQHFSHVEKNMKLRNTRIFSWGYSLAFWLQNILKVVMGNLHRCYAKPFSENVYSG